MSLRPCGWSPWLRVQLGWSFAIMPVTSLPGWFIEITSKLNIDSLSIHFGSAKKHYRTMPWPNIYTVEAVRDSPLKQFQPSDAFGGEVIMAAPLSQPAAGWKAQKLRHLAVEWDGKALPRHGGPWWSSLSRKIKAMTWRWEWNKFQRSTFSPNGMKSHATLGQSTHLHHEPSDPSGLPSRLPIPQ